ncbi:hypothetical protein, partial [Mesorhizobium sp.]
SPSHLSPTSWGRGTQAGMAANYVAAEACTPEIDLGYWPQCLSLTVGETVPGGVASGVPAREPLT